MRKIFAERPNHPGGIVGNFRTLAVVLAGLLTVSTAAAQDTKTTTKGSSGAQNVHHSSRSKAAAALAKEPLAATPAPPPPPPKPLPPERMPPQIPQVVWDGKLLTINADNSTLSDILVAVRMLTGADVDVPAEASRERIAARLGPAPPREVLSTLLSWTNFDFVIQASDTDPDGLRNVILTPRAKSDTVVAAGNNGAESTRSAFFARANGRKNAPGPAAENPAPAPENPTPVSAETAEVPQPEPTPASEKSQADTTQAPSPAAPSPKPAAVEPPSSDVAATAVASDSQGTSSPAATPSTTATDTSSSAPANPTQEKIQQMQSMFEQRKQMIIDARKQAQQSQ